jgi:type II secretory pathway component PulJ
MTRPQSTRRAYALIEMVLVIGTIAIVLGLCAGLLHVLLRLDRTGRAHLVETATIGRLARQFRADVHAASEASNRGKNAATANLDLELAGERRIVYEAGDRALVRTEQQGATVERRERYTLPFCRAGRFRLRTTDDKVWVILELRRSPGGESESGPRSLRHDLQIEALAGRDQGRLLVPELQTRKEALP